MGKLRQSEVTQWVCCQCVQQQETSLYLLSETCGAEVWARWKLPETISLQPRLLLHLKLTYLGQSYEKKIDSALYGSSAVAFPMVHCQYHSKGLGFLGRKGCSQLISWPWHPDLHRMLLLSNSRIIVVIINTWWRGVRVVKSIVITHGVPCWRTGCASGSRALGSLLSSHTAREIPQSSSAAFLQEFSCPCKAPPDTGLLPLRNRENIILPLWNVVIQPSDHSLWSCTCSLDSLCLSPAAQSPWIGKARAAAAQSVCTGFVYWPWKGAETDQVLTQTGDSFGLIWPRLAAKPLSLIWYHRWAHTLSWP